MIVTQISIDLSGLSRFEYVIAKQADADSRLIQVQLLDNGKIYVLDNLTTARVSITKPDKTEVLDDCTINNNRVEIVLDANMLAVAGTATAEIILTGSSGDVLTSASFDIKIIASATGKNAESSSDYKSFKEALAAADNITRKFGEETPVIVKECLEDNSQEMATLTINGQQYNGSEDVVIDMGGVGGGSSEATKETQLATGTIPAETAAGSVFDTGITLAALKEYKRFVFVFKGASNVGAQNVYLTFSKASGSYTIARSDSASGLIYEYEWLNVDEGLLRCCNLYQGNTSLVRNIGSNYIVTAMPASFGNGMSGGSAHILFDLSGVEDDGTLKVYMTNATTIEYTWEVRGMTV